MNSDTLTQLIQKGFRVTLGATATLVETLQDPQRREANLSKLTTELGQLAEELETKGATTEQEARNFVDTLWRERTNQTTSQPTSQPPTPSTVSTPVAPDVQQDLQELTAQIAAIRAEIERLRSQDNA
jgi:polyhydroxyalkanoate synthesis regulator phasin